MMEVIAERDGPLPGPLDTLKLGKVLGRGGFAVVYRGTLGAAQVAVKCLLPADPAEPTGGALECKLFLDEARLMIALDHSNIIKAYALLKLPSSFPGLSGFTQPTYALVLELMEGGSLAGLMVKQLLAGSMPKYTFSRALGWCLDVARALQYLHAGGRDGAPRVHRDVKLENVLLSAGMATAKLADFGLQRALNTQHDAGTMLVRRSQRPSTIQPMRTGPVGPSRMSFQAVAHAGGSLGGTRPQSASMDAGRPTSSNALPTAAALNTSERTLFYTIDDTGMVPLASPPAPPMPSAAAAAGDDASRPLSSGAQDDTVTLARCSASMPQLDMATSLSERPAGGAAAAAAHPAPDQAVSPGKAPRLPAEQSYSRGATPGVAPVHRPPQVRTPSRSTASRVGLSPLGTSPASRANAGSSIGGAQEGASSPLGPSSYSQSHHSHSMHKSASVGPSGTGLRSGLETKASLPDHPGLSSTCTMGPNRSGTSSLPASGVGGFVAEAAGKQAAAGSSPGELRVPDPVLIGSPAEELLQPVLSPRGDRQAWEEVSELHTGSSTSASPSRVVPLMEDAPPVSPRNVAGGASRAALAAQRPSSRLREAATAGLHACVPGAAWDAGSEAAGAAGVEAVATVAESVLDAGPKRPLLPGSAKHVGSRDSTEKGYEPNSSLAAGDQSEGEGEGAVKKALNAPSAPGGTAAGERTAALSGCATPAASDPGMAPSSRCISPTATRRSVHPTTSPNVQQHSQPGGVGSAVAVALLAQSYSRSQQGAESAPMAHMQIADLLSSRLNNLNISVRSVRAGSITAMQRPGSASGALAGRQGQGNGHNSLPSSPRRAAVVGAARAAAVSQSGMVGSAHGAEASSPTKQRTPLAAAAAHASEFEEVFSLTGRTGSMVYLAPEAYKNEPYNDKVDVYSLGILMYELFGRTSITYTHISTKLPAFSRMLCNADEFAERVAAGYRPPRPNQMDKLPPELWELIEAAWHQDPVQRPGIDVVVEQLEALVEPLAEAEAAESARQGLCGCVIS